MQEDFQSGSAGATITSSNTAFTAVDHSGISAVFDAGLVIKNSQSAKIVTDADGGRFAMIYTFDDTTQTLYARWYMHITEFSSQNMTLATLRSNSDVIAQFRVNTNRTVSLQDGNLAIATSSAVMPQSEWVRCEWMVNTNLGTQEARIFAGDTYNSADISDAIMTLGGTAPTGSPIESYRVGLTVMAASYQANYDAVYLRTSTWAGPDPEAVTQSDLDSAYSGVVVAGERRPVTKYGVRVDGVWRPVVALGHRADGVWRPAPVADTPPGGGDEIPSYSFQSSGLTGGGFQNVIAISPFLDSQGRRPYIDGADVSGIFYSVDQARTWIPSNRSGHIASLMWSDTVPGECFAAANEGLFRSTDFGRTWSTMSRPANYDADANGNYTIDNQHPRPTGSMMAQDNSGSTKYLWLATATRGVQRRDNGSWITSTVLSGRNLRSIASDPNNPDILYVAVADANSPATSGIYRSTNARGAMTFTKMTEYPPTATSGSRQYVEEFFIFNDSGTTVLYVAGNSDGIFRYRNGAWTALNTGIDTSDGSGARWLSIAGYRDSGGQIVLFAGATNAVLHQGSWNQRRRTVMRSLNGGSSWSPISVTENSDVDTTIYGTAINSWLSSVTYHDFSSNLQWTPACIVLDPDLPNRVIIAGRGGVWIGFPGTRYTWQPAHNGLMVTVNMAVVADPINPSGVIVGNMDYTFFYSGDSGTSFQNTLPTQPSGATTGDVVTFDATTGHAYLASSARGHPAGAGGVYSIADPYQPGALWTNENIPVGGNNDMRALGVGRDSSGTRVILTAISGGGFYRKRGSTWTRITGGPFDSTGDAVQGSFAWEGTTPTVYTISPTGVWRSDQAGSQDSWIRIHAASSTYGILDALRIDPTDPEYLYVVNAGGSLIRINNAKSTTSTATTNTTNLISSGIGPIAINKNGHLYAHARSAKLYRYLDPRATSPAYTEIHDTLYSYRTGNIRSMDVTLDNYIFTADNGNGVAMGVPSAPGA